MPSGITEQALAAARAGAVVVTANTRAARNLRLAYDLEQQAGGQGAWPSAEIHTWGAWLRRLWEEHLLRAEDLPPVLLEHGQEAQVWQEVIRRAAPEMHPVAAARAAARSWRLAWSYAIPLADAAFRSRADSEVFRGWAQAFQKRCQQNNWLDEARLPEYLQPLITSATLPVPTRLLLVGFDELTPQQEAFLAALRGRGSTWEQAEPCPPSKAVCVAAREGRAELAAAARWTRQLLQRQPQARIAVVVPDLEGARARVERTLLEALQPEALNITSRGGRRAFDISLGRPLAEHPVVAAALLGLRLTRGSLSSAEASRLLRSPFFAGAQSEFTARALIDARLRRRGGDEVTLEALIAAAARTPRLLLSLRWFRKRLGKLPAEAAPSQWARHFSRLLESLGWPGDRPQASEERQALNRWSDLLSRFARLDLVLPAVRAADAVSLLAEAAGEQVFQPENEGAPVQVLGMLEAAGSEFDHMWVMGLHDGAWPTAARPDAFLPFALQREHGLPGSSPQAQLEAARRVLQRLRSSAPQVVLSYPLSDGENELRPSPLLLEGEIAQGELTAVAPGADGGWAPSLLGSCERDELADESGPEFAGVIAPGGTTLFRLQGACPFRAFAELRLDARPLEEPQPGLDPRRRGTVVHLALQYVWEALKDRAHLLQTVGAERERLVADCVDRALTDARALGDTEWERRFRQMEQARLTEVLLEWLAEEEKRADFRVLLQEKKMPATLGDLTFHIQADRVDEVVPGGARVVIDYKTGALGPSAKAWESERPDEPQLPIYAATMDAELAAVAFAHVRRGSMKFTGQAAAEDVLPGVKPRPGQEMRQVVAEWRRVLEQLAADFRAGAAAVHPKSGAKTCAYCPLPSLCRIRELEPLRLEEENGTGESDE